MTKRAEKLIWQVFRDDYVYRDFDYEDLKEAIEYAQGNHPDSPFSEKGMTVRQKIVPEDYELRTQWPPYHRTYG